MDRRERIPAKSHNALLVALRAALQGWQAGVWTALPAVVQSYNAAAGTVEAKPTIQAQVRQPDGTWVNTTLPMCVDCPVKFPGGGGFVLSFPVAKGDEGVLVFASRCIDAWWKYGGIQKQTDLRMHDLSDGFYFPGSGLSQPNLPKNLSTIAVELRSVDGKTLIHVEPELLEASVNNGSLVLTLNDTTKIITLASGGTSLMVNNTTEEVSVTAINGLWVNGVKVTVP